MKNNGTFRAVGIEYFKGIPILTLETDEGYHRYISEFRSYGFQFSYNLDGEGDAGSSAMFTKMKTMFNLMTNDECYAFICDTVNSIIHRYQYDIEDKIPNTWYGPGSELWGRWIKESIIWIRTNGRDYR